MRNLLFLATLVLYVSLSFAGDSELQKVVDNFANKPDLKNASVSFLAVDLANNQVLAQYDAKRLLAPASTTKLWSTAAALELLGANYKPKTELYYTGEIKNNTLEGSLIVRGFGDVSLGSHHFVKREKMRDFLDAWADSLRNLGIQKISGSVVADASSFGYFGPPDGWSWSDMGNYYGAFPSGLTIFDNMMELFFNTPSKAGAATSLVRTNPLVPNFVIQNYVLADNITSDNAYVYGAPYSNYAFVTGTLPLSKTNFVVKGVIQNPELVFALEFHAALIRKGIEVQGVALANNAIDLAEKEKAQTILKEKTRLIFTHFGASLFEVAELINYKSVNLFAEHLPCWIAIEKKGDGHHKEGMKLINEFWSSKFDISASRINDGSGLSRTNAISAQNFIDLLTYMHKSGSKDFERTLPIAGESGTLKNLCKGQAGQGKIMAKSGTMSKVKSYAGYVNTKSGKKLAFAIIVNNHTNSSSALTTQMETVLNAMASL
jgi:serine-type D-Ala-D-Ala carboxypeptidase/endopeptidase (penicillin-binding protein 4)